MKVLYCFNFCVFLLLNCIKLENLVTICIVWIYIPLRQKNGFYGVLLNSHHKVRFRINLTLFLDKVSKSNDPLKLILPIKASFKLAKYVGIVHNKHCLNQIFAQASSFFFEVRWRQMTSDRGRHKMTLEAFILEPARRCNICWSVTPGVHTPACTTKRAYLGLVPPSSN